MSAESGISTFRDADGLWRNHRIEEVITSARNGDFAPFHALLAAITVPYAPLTDATAPFARAPSKDEQVTRTFCGT